MIDNVKPQNVMGEDWRYLIIFDACRYDYFEKYYKNYLIGKLKERESPAIWTLEWLEKIFTEYYPDIAYISSTFFCNSKKSNKMNGSFFDAKDHFVKIYDAWRKAEDIVVPPQTINKITRKAVLSHPEWRFIIHYLQPHHPCLADEMEFRHLFTARGKEGTDAAKHSYKMKILNYLGRTMRIFSSTFLWKFNKFFSFKPRSYEEVIWRKKGDQGLINGYEENVKTVMNYAKQLIEHLPPGKVIITSDHGELLGERHLFGRFFGHGVERPRLPELLYVPWFEVER